MTWFKANQVSSLLTTSPSKSDLVVMGSYVAKTVPSSLSPKPHPRIRLHPTLLPSLTHHGSYHSNLHGHPHLLRYQLAHLKMKYKRVSKTRLKLLKQLRRCPTTQQSIPRGPVIVLQGLCRHHGQVVRPIHESYMLFMQFYWL